MITPRNAIYAAIVAAIFFAGWKSAALIWSSKYDSLKTEHAERIEEQRRRLQSRQDRLNDETQAREGELLRELEISRSEFETLQNDIKNVPLTYKRIVRAPISGEVVDCGPRVDWGEFGRLYDRAAATGPAAEDSSTSSVDAAAGETTDAR